MKKTEEFLLSDKNPLDSWDVYPMHIKPSQNKFTNDFLSDIDKNYQKYGYRELGKGTSDNNSIYFLSSRHVAGNMIWENDYTNRLEVEKMVNDLKEHRMENQIRKVSGNFSFYLPVLGIELDQVLNKSFAELDWNYLDQQKLIRANEYKTRLYNSLNLQAYPESLEDSKTFTELLLSKRLLH